MLSPVYLGSDFFFELKTSLDSSPIPTLPHPQPGTELKETFQSFKC